MRFFVLFLFLLVSGCVDSRVSETGPFVGGDSGLDISFAFMPDSAYGKAEFESSPFDIDLLVENKGESLVQEGEAHFRISGFLPSDFMLDDPKRVLEEALEPIGKDPEGNVISGTQAHVTWNDLAYQKEVAGSIDFPVRVDACYRYSTDSSFKLCFYEDLSEQEDHKVCSLRGPKESFSSGSPVQIGSVDEDVSGRTMVGFSFRIYRTGDDAIFLPTVPGMSEGKVCGWERSGIESIMLYLDKVYAEVVTGLDGLNCPEMECSGGACNGIIKLFNSERAIHCTQESPGKQDFEKPVSIKLTYNIEKTIETTLNVIEPD